MGPSTNRGVTDHFSNSEKRDKKKRDRPGRCEERPTEPPEGESYHQTRHCNNRNRPHPRP